MQFAGNALDNNEKQQRSITVECILITNWIFVRNYPLHVSKVYDRNKFDMALMHLIGNFQQIFEYFNVDRKFKKTNFRTLFQALVNLLYDGCVK